MLSAVKWMVCSVGMVTPNAIFYKLMKVMVFAINPAIINPGTKDPKKGNAGYRRQSLVFLDAGSESGMTVGIFNCRVNNSR